MTKAKSVGEKLASLNQLRDELSRPDTANILARSLSDPSNYVVERAAEIIGDGEFRDTINSLVAAYRRLLINPLKSDSGCIGKTAIVRTLVRLEYDDPDFFREAIVYQQLTATWGGPKDAAAELRGLAAAGLIYCVSRVEFLNSAAMLLADTYPETRIGAAQALGVCGHLEGAPLVRLKLLLGDSSPEVIGECCAALLRLDPEDSMPTVRRFLSSDNGDVCSQVALALGASRHLDAFSSLKRAWELQTDSSLRESLLLCIGIHRTSDAINFLLSLLTDKDLTTATQAMRALKIHDRPMREKVEEAITAANNSELTDLFLNEWPE